MNPFPLFISIIKFYNSQFERKNDSFEVRWNIIWLGCTSNGGIAGNGSFKSSKRTNVRRNLRPGNSKYLWNAVNAAKDIGASSLPQSMKFESMCANLSK